ncbi:uncharacterized protein LACBIDRAFT_329146 [Laccaria bicolor S238N-H82]|uniref:Predicted protein n=1 Tax=Laccaria bicolor (strain S238N-H82 / ATCC MYA-4686) TaxID=486041 RepID=B0DH76_LACBS|nr:uncharacterized protein LACBIDRAFT_329146 [Laccaria bicolor S238N-H82]EDR06061.1 predicted protein [Laccaria bicolor S238N-H82]|eukprot:XP_001883349.1 predicted protein [Laccaria bicolor S238N-H82]
MPYEFHSSLVTHSIDTYSISSIQLTPCLPLHGSLYGLLTFWVKLVRTVVHKKMAVVVALEEVKSEDQRELAMLVSAARANLDALYHHVLEEGSAKLLNGHVSPIIHLQNALENVENA